jgi:hypothetical protein
MENNDDTSPKPQAILEEAGTNSKNEDGKRVT